MRSVNLHHRPAEKGKTQNWRNLEMTKLKNWLKKEAKETRILLKCIPAPVFTLFVISIVAMNLLANKLIVNESWIALDAGILCSWIAFLAMDIMVRRFGPKASTKIAVVGLFFNLIVAAVFALAALIPGDWALNDYATATSWWVIGASTAAFLVSAIANNLMYWIIRRAFKKNPEGVGAHIMSSWVSTALGQFIDNLTFALIFTLPFNASIGVSITVGGLFGFAAAGAVVELICEVIFTPVGWRISERWRRQGIGIEYLIATQQIKGEVAWEGNS